jgi:hypothetical protein
MKKLIRTALAIISFTLFIFTISCNNNDEENPFDDEAKLAYETLIAVQDSSDIVLAGFESSMDSSAAVEALAQWFRNHDNVEWAKVGSQGITVSYTNGMYGGILLDPGSYDEPVPSIENQPLECTSESQPSLKNLPTYKKGRVVAAALNEFPNIFMWQIQSWEHNLLNNLGLPSVYNMDDEITLDYLKQLQSKQSSIISLNSHGLAWPDDHNIEEVYFLTGEAAYNHTTELFYKDMLEKRVILIKYKNSTRYCIAPGFITKYNDFSKDTVLFYGSFCYSFLGNWPQIVDGCASGTYFGVNWKVRSGKCANWAVDLIKNMSDKSFEEPWTVEDWMTMSEIPKSYYDEEYQKNISINYNGNSTLTLWQPEYNAEGGIEALAIDKAPILVPGKTCTEYTLRCNVNGQLPPQVYYFWDLGHETAFNMNQTGNEVVGRWGLPGTYTVKVEVRNSSNDEVIKEFDTQVTIEDPSYLEEVKSYPYFEMIFSYMNGPCITLTNGETLGNGFFQWETNYFTSPLVWTDSSFQAESFTPSGNGGTTMTIQGEMSSDGKTIRHCLLTITKIHSDGQFDQESKLEIANMTICIHDEWNCWQSYIWNFEGAASQNYVQSVEYKKFDYQEQEWITIQSVNWENSILYGKFYNQ